MATILKRPVESDAGERGDHLSLPAWLYRDPEYFAVEMDRVQRDYPRLDTATHGLAPVDVDIWRSFIFIRLAGDGRGDTQIIERVQHGMASPSYTVGPLGASEVCLANFARKLRHSIPEAALPEPRPAGWNRRASA